LLFSVLALATAIFGLIEYSLGPVVVAHWGPGFDPFRSGNPWFSTASHHLVLRPYSFFTAPALAAEFCTFSLIPAGWLTLQPGQPYFRLVGVASMVLASAFVFLSGVRVVTLQLVVILVLLAVLGATRSRRTAILGIVCSVGIGLALFTSPQIMERMALAPDARAEYLSPSNVVDLVSQSPLGQGLGTSQGTGSFENYYLLLAGDTGWPGVMLMVILVGAVAWITFRRGFASNHGPEKFLYFAVGAYVLTLAFVAWTSLNLDKPTVAYPLWSLAGLCTAVRTGSREPFRLQENPG
jgi:hypothetical protein